MLTQSTIAEFINAIDERTILARHLINKILLETNQPDIAEIEGGNYACIQNTESEILSGNWYYNVHGEHCLFVNKTTNQEIEVSLGTDQSLENLDPYFFYKFLATAEDYKHLAEIFKSPFKEILFLFEILEEQGTLKRIHGVEFRKAGA